MATSGDRAFPGNGKLLPCEEQPCRLRAENQRPIITVVESTLMRWGRSTGDAEGRSPGPTGHKPHRQTRPELTLSLVLADASFALILKRSTGTLVEWLSRAGVGCCPEVRHFVEGVHLSESTVDVVITLRRTNRAVESHTLPRFGPVSWM